jgi:hypothetical protein
MRRRLKLLVCLAVANATAAGAQPVTVKKLGAPAATLEIAFTVIEGVRELQDGRVIVLDSRDKAIHLADFKTGTSTRIGRDGDGPGEFRLPQRIHSLPGDSSAVSDFARPKRFLVITSAGRAAGFIASTDTALGWRANEALAVDDRGRFYFEYRGSDWINDSVAVVRWDRKQRHDTIAKFDPRPVSPLWEPQRVIPFAGGGIATVPKVMPYSTNNQWALARDGRIALVTAEPYRVTFVNANGVRITGPVIAFSPVPVAAAERKDFLADIEKPHMGMRGSSRSQTAEYGYWKSRPDPSRLPKEWPSHMPPFARGAVAYAPDGMLWVRRNVKSGAPPLIDVIDGGGRVAFQVELPPNTKIVAFGVGVVYLARVDDDDLHYLEKYRLPAR